MTFKWEDYLELANFLSMDGNEAKRRTAISRAYYSAFMIVKRVLEGKDQDYIYKIQALEKNTARFSTHDVVWKTLVESPDITKNEIGRIGNRLKLRRVDADYNENISISRESVMKCLSDSSTIINKARKLYP